MISIPPNNRSLPIFPCVETNGSYQLSQGDEHELPLCPLEIRITHGTAWVSFAEIGHIMYAGDILFLPRSQEAAVISPLYSGWISYEVKPY